VGLSNIHWVLLVKHRHQKSCASMLAIEARSQAGGCSLCSWPSCLTEAITSGQRSR
jgi:hypothetical protein